MAEEKKKVTRQAKPTYAVMSVSDGNGGSLDVSKDDVVIHGMYKNADELLGVLEGGGLPAGTFYKLIPAA